MPRPPETITLRGAQTWLDPNAVSPHHGPEYIRLEEQISTGTTYMYMFWQKPCIRLVSFTEDSGPDLREVHAPPT